MDRYGRFGLEKNAKSRPKILRDIIGNMARHSFPYYPVLIDPSPAFPNGYTAHRPAAFVSLRVANNRTSEFLAVMDTGADHCMFPSDYLAVLGLDKASLPTSTVHGVGTDDGTRFATVNLSIGQLEEWPVYASFSDHWMGQHVGFLGHFGFFNRFTTNFDPHSRICEVGDLSNG